ncbi:Uu.00g125480.m01.CDS01 [Anthostomella pinea]|uniref:Uu.00g125480.m01.CDS01 n=1 Tax=Anthostomella pinea TaxID=933095 RepID=A0AAI8VIU1_9PEZI|nr:Uu.00g125480.m01.CDS01 [Anthostomella pinea]
MSPAATLSVIRTNPRGRKSSRRPFVQRMLHSEGTSGSPESMNRPSYSTVEDERDHLSDTETDNSSDSDESGYNNVPDNAEELDGSQGLDKDEGVLHSEHSQALDEGASVEMSLLPIVTEL